MRMPQMDKDAEGLYQFLFEADAVGGEATA
jgi:hypothetical protein